MAYKSPPKTMNKNVILLFGIVICMLSCTKSKNDIVKDEFHKYVSQNFDDPNDLKEIVSIELIDTISYEGFCNGTKLLYEASEQIESLVSLENNQCDSIINYLQSHKPVTDEYKRGIVKEWLIQHTKLNSDMINWNDIYFDETRFLKMDIDSLLEKTKNLMLYEYEIKVRVNEGANLKLKQYYALEDSIKIRFFDKKPTFSEYSEEASKYYEAAKKYEEIYSIRHNIVLEKLKQNKKVMYLLD
jgi:hypothetical protein